jgi:hypothetical protein
MKKIISIAMLTAILFSTATFAQDDKTKRPSPPAKAESTLQNGNTVSIDYSQPSVKGRTVGVNLEPMPGTVWRTGANEATVFETSKDITVEGQTLKAGKYALFTLVDGDNWTFIFNKTWKQWGAFGYKEADDVLRVKVKSSKLSPAAEKLSFSIDKNGKVELKWSDIYVAFIIK